MGFCEEIRPFLPMVAGDRLALGMGCATIGGRADEALLETYRRTLEDAYAAGLRYFDSSPLYGGSEFRLGEFLRGVPRASYFLATKSLLPDAFTPQEAAVHVRQSLRNSRERLGVDMIDLFQIHDVQTLDQVLLPGGVLEALLAARAAGEIRYIGLATRRHDLLETAVRHGDFDTILTYMDYTPINTTASEVIRLATEKRVGVINGSPLSFGLLTGDDPRKREYPSGEWDVWQERAVRLYDLCQARNLSVLNLALRFPLQNPNIAITLTGPGAPEELRATLTAAATPVPSSLWQEIHATLGM